MTAADWIDDLERKAKAATPGPWEVDNDDCGYASPDAPMVATPWVGGRRTHIVGSPARPHGKPLPENAEFIAAANPTTILRLIRELQVAERKARGFAYDLRITEAVSDQRAARLAAVEDLVAEWERVQEQNRKALGELARGTSHLLLDTPGPADFRAALAAPTDTAKEN